MVCVLHGCHDAHPKMRFSLSPPPPKAVATPSLITAPPGTTTTANMQQFGDDAASDYHQWLHAMKLVARLPGGMPPEFRRKLWLSLADKYLKSRNIVWAKEEEKCFSEQWREDDEELGTQIVKDLHRTGSNLCTGPAGDVNQAKLKRILLGYARFNPEVGYCQVMDKEEIESMKVMIYLVEGILPPGYFCGSMGGLQADMGVFRELMQTKLPRLAKHLQRLQGPLENAYEPPLTNVFTMQWFLTMFCTCLPMSCVLRVWDLVLIEGSDVLLRTALVLWSLLEERVLKARTADDFYGKMGSFSSELLNGHLIDSNGLIEKIVQLGPIPDIQKLRDKHLYNIAPLRHHQQGFQFYFNDEGPESDEDSRLAVATVWGIPWGRRGSQVPAANTTNKQIAENKDRIALDISLLKKQYDRLRERQKQAHIILTSACSTTRQGTASTTTNTTVPVNHLLMGRSAIITARGRRAGPPAGAIPPARKPSLPTVLQTKPPEKQLRRGETLHWRDADLAERRRDSLTWKEIKAERAALSLSGSGDGLQSKKLRMRRLGKSDSSSYSEESEDDDEDNSSTDTSLCDDDNAASAGDHTHRSTENSPKQRAKHTRRPKDGLPATLPHLADVRGDNVERKRPKSWAPSASEIPFMLMTTESAAHSGDEDPGPLPEIGPESKPDAEPENQKGAQPAKDEEDSATESGHFHYRSLNDPSWSDTKYSPIAGDLATIKFGPVHLEEPSIGNASQLSPIPDVPTYLKSSSISPLPMPKAIFAESTNSLGSGEGDESSRFDVSDDGVTNQYFERVNSVERPNKLNLFYSLSEEKGIRNTFRSVEPIESPFDHSREDTIDKTLEVNNETSSASQMGDNVEEVDKGDATAPSQRLELLKDYSETPSTLYKVKTDRELSTILTNDRPSDFPPLNERDNNIPGENLDDHTDREFGSKTFKIYDSVKTDLNCKSSKKRRDPRRLTLTRSSTMEIEERFRALEKRLSMDTSLLSADLTSKDPKHFNTPPDLELIDKSAHIPLNPFHGLEMGGKLSEQSGSYDKPSPSENFLHSNDVHIKIGNEIPFADRGPKSSSGEDRPEISYFSEKKRNSEIPKERSVVLEKQMSFSSSNTDSPIHLESNCPNEDNAESSDPNRRTSREKEEESGKVGDEISSSVNAKISDQHPPEVNDPQGPRSALKKIPSTEELETRFNALERQASIHSDRFPKKPPDEPGEQRAPRQPQKSADNQQESNADDQNKEEIPTSSTQAVAQIDQKVPKKPPPSTEELEKRFDALEKRLSSASLGGDNKSRENLPHHVADLATKHETQTTEETASQPSSELTEDKDEATNENISQGVGEGRISVSETDCSKGTPPMDNYKSTNGKTPEKLKETTENASAVPSRPELVIDSKRRASEPPSTEELDKRFESLKRRMSSKALDGNFPSKVETVEEALERIEKEVIEEITEADDLQTVRSLGEGGKTDTNERNRNERRSKSPPSTESLENRFEALQKQSLGQTKATEDRKEDLPSKVELSETQHCTVKETEEDPPQAFPVDRAEAASLLEIPEGIDQNQKKASSTTSEERRSPRRSLNRTLKDDTDNCVPKAPPMPAAATDGQLGRRHHQALIEELREKIHAQPNDENIRPSAINSHRKPIEKEQPQSLKVDDETSETHASTAFYRSENYEPWHPPSNSQMVRRFSDLPSRADLENRLEFLERQLCRQFYKQRCAGDSEVASKKRAPQPPNTSKSSGSITALERRVQALEKQLSDTSLRLVAAPHTRVPLTAAECTSPSRRLSTETVDISGKELVRYAHWEEVDGTGSHKPINISISIKMSLKKEEATGQKDKTDAPPPTEHLEKRLQVLEEQLINNRNQSSLASTEGAKEDDGGSADLYEDNEIVQLPEVRKEVKDIANEEAKSDTKETTKNEEALADGQLRPDDHPKKDITKEEKTMENQEIIRRQEIISSAVESAAIPEVQKEETDKEPAAPTSANEEGQVESEEKNGMEGTIAEETKAADPAAFDAGKKTLVLLLDNEPKAVKVRRLTRANTAELEDLFQALEKQLSARNLAKSDDAKPNCANVEKAKGPEETKETEALQSISDLTKEIEQFTGDEEQVAKVAEKPETEVEVEAEEEFDWGRDPAKHHLKRKTVYLPSTRELEARFRSLERQIKLLEDVEKIDVEQRLDEIERKIKLQYSLSHEKDLSKFLELCEGKGAENDQDPALAVHGSKTERSRSPKQLRSSLKSKSPHISPSRATTPPRCDRNRLPVPRTACDDVRASAENLECRFRTLNLHHSKSKECLCEQRRKKELSKKQPIHPLEMLLDPSPEEDHIPTTGELEHRIRVLNERGKTPSPPTHHTKTPEHKLEKSVSPSMERELPTAEELELRLQALEQEHCFDFKTQQNFKEFNQKLKDIVTPSQSFEEFKATKSRDHSPKPTKRPTTPKAQPCVAGDDEDLREPHVRPISPKVIRFRDDEEYRPKSRNEGERMKTLADSNGSSRSSIPGALAASASEGVDAMGTRLMRETSPIRRTGTHTGVPLRTDDNINERLTSIKNTIKSIDTLCEEKPYRRERCQRYIDSLFSDSVHFGSKKSSWEELTLRADNRAASREFAPSTARISEHSQALTRSVGSVESIRSTSPLRAASPLQYRSNRDLRRDLSPRRQRDEHESRVRRDDLLPNHLLSNRYATSPCDSLTKFHKVDRHVDTYSRSGDGEGRPRSRSASRSPLKSPCRPEETTLMMHNTTPPHTASTATTATTTTTTTNNKRVEWDRPVSPYRQTGHTLLAPESAKRPNAPAYTPAKLEIRHTTVTSTFYDRLLAEKQLEKALCSSRSPTVSPSTTSGGYLDIRPTSANVSPTRSPQPAQAALTVDSARGQMGASPPLIRVNSTNEPGCPPLPPSQPSAVPPSISPSLSRSPSLPPSSVPSVTVGAKNELASQLDLYMRDCEDMLTQLNPVSALSGAASRTAPLNGLPTYDSDPTTAPSGPYSHLFSSHPQSATTAAAAATESNCGHLPLSTSPALTIPRPAGLSGPQPTSPTNPLNKT